ncbi:MAG: hypothetical protein KBD16_02580 [Candidatus Pacebacteria bacterium]|nr:hypothetical protein [Candidatus Paceibacterota bacterium]
MTKSSGFRSLVRVPGMPAEVAEEIASDAESRAGKVGRALRNATDGQRGRARTILGRYLNKYGWSSATQQIEVALSRFDAGEYDDPNIARFLGDEQLTLALSNKEFRIRRYGDVTTEPPKKQWDSAGGYWYED